MAEAMFWLGKDGDEPEEEGAFEVTGTLPSGDRWTFLTKSSALADCRCREMREDFQNVVLNDLLKAEAATSDHPYRVSGKDEQGDLWIFSSSDRKHVLSVLADCFDGYRDVKFTEPGVGHGKA